MAADPQDSQRDRDPVDLLAESFLARFRRGERPSIDEYAARYPHLAGEVHELLPALVALERDLSVGEADATGGFEGRPSPGPIEGNGPRVLGDYLIVRELGRGGMGVVYEAVQQSLGRHVALKVLPWNELGDSGRLERFRLEARAAARMHHTHIVPVFGVGEHGGIHYYAMQYIRGQGLDLVIAALDRLRKRPEKAAAPAPVAEIDHLGFPEPSKPAGPVPVATGARALTEAVARGLRSGDFASLDRDGHDPTATLDRVPQPSAPTPSAPSGNDSHSALLTHPGVGSGSGRFFREAARVALQAAEALAYAHGQGILHRDIKPSNLLLDVAGQVWVTDFGLAKAEGSDGPTRTGDIVGTLRYMAPERMDGSGDRRIDVYGLGATLYELVTLRPIFEGSTRARLVEMILHGQPVAPRRIDPRIPRDLETIILKSIDKDPDQRYRDAESMAEDLRLFLEDKPIRARRIGRVEILARWCRRNPLLAATAGTLAVLLVAVSIGSTLLARRFRDDSEANRRRLVRLNVAAGIDRMDQGDVIGALPYLAGALELDRESETHRLRLGAALRRAPRLVELWAHPSIVQTARFASDGRRVVSAGFDGAARVFAVGSESPVAPALSHALPVVTAAFSPDGCRIVTASRDGSARVWDAISGQPLTPPIKTGGPLEHAAFSPDGDRLVTASTSGEARVWNAETGAAVTPILKHALRVGHAAFSPDGTRLATACDDGQVRIWDATTGEPIGAPRNPGRTSRLAFSPDGTRLAAASWDGKGRVWDLSKDGGEIWAATHANVVSDLQFSPDGTRLATASWDGTARIWDAATGKPVTPTIAQSGAVNSIVFSPDGQRILCAGAGGAAMVADARTGKLVAAPLTHNGSVMWAEFSPDGQRIVTAAADRFVRVWEDVSGQVEDAVLVHQDRVTHASFSPDGTRIVTADSSGGARVWASATGEPASPRFHHAKIIEVAEFSHDGLRIVTASWDGTARVWDALTGVAVTPPLHHGEPIHDAAFSPDGRLVATSCEDGSARLWKTDTGAAVEPHPRHERGVRHASFSPDGRFLLTASNDATARVWDIAAGRWAGPALRHGGIVFDAEFSPDGTRVATGSEDGTARVWDPFTGREVAPPVIHRSWVLRVGFSPDGRTALAGASDGTVLVWNVADGRLVCPPITHHGSVYSASFSRNGRWLATAGFDGVGRVWDVANGEPITLPLTHEGAVWSVAFSPDGTHVATAGTDRTARLWSLHATTLETRELVRFAELLSGRTFDSSGQLVPLGPEELLKRWRLVRPRLGEPARSRR